MSIIKKAYKMRIYPNRTQRSKLNQTFGCVRVVWNAHVENFNLYGKGGYNPNLSSKMLKGLDKYHFLNEVSAGALQQKDRDFNEFKKQYFSKKRKKKLGKPHFKKRGIRDSFRLPNQKFKLDQELKFIKLEKIGYIKINLDRSIPDDAKYLSVTISKSPTGKFYASILVEQEIEHKQLTGNYVGIDLGLHDIFTLSNGMKIEAPRFYRKIQAKLRKAQKALSRKKKGSNRYNKQRLKVAKLYEKVNNQRKYFTHVITTAIVSSFDLICMEDLNITGMIKNKKLAKSISDASWGEILRQLEYKCVWYGKSFVKVDRWFASSQTCSCCGTKDGKKELSVRGWTCSNCGAMLDRDINASINILKRGYRDLTSAELVDYRRAENVSLIDVNHHLAASLKR